MNKTICKNIALLILLIVISGCSGGFLGDSSNAEEFKNPIFNTEDTDTTEDGVTTQVE